VIFTGNEPRSSDIPEEDAVAAKYGNNVRRLFQQFFERKHGKI
jgi:hypothetical protein